VSPAQQVVLTVIGAALLIGTIAYGVFRFYA